MYWDFIGINLQENTLKDDVIYKLAKFLIEKPKFFYFTVDFLIKCKERNSSKIKYDLRRIQKILERIKISDITIDPKEIDQFFELFCKYSNII